MKPLTKFEETLLWMAIRYAMNRETIASATLPAEIMSNWYERIDESTKKRLASDLERNSNRQGAFGHPDIDRPHWVRFWKCMDESCHYQVELIDGSVITVFNADDKIIPLEKYVNYPHQNWTLPPENIKCHANLRP